MSSVTSLPPHPYMTSWFDRAAAVAGMFSRQATLALGLRGVAWASGAGVVGLISCLVAFVMILSAFNTAGIDHRRTEAEETAALAASFREVIRSLQPGRYGTANIDDSQRVVLATWASFYDRLTAICTQDSSASTAALLSSICEVRVDFRSLVLPEVEAFNPPARPLEPRIVLALLAMGRDLHERANAATENLSKLVADMARSYRTAILVLTLSTAGFVTAGLVLIFLVGRGSMLHFELWQNAAAAATAATEARDLLKETIEALPAGVVLYDAEERLMLFNSLAASVTPGLKRPGVIGTTYTALAREAGEAREAAGMGPRDDWVVDQITRFRTKRDHGVRQLPDGRWFEWYEQSTATGYTVGLRVDVTERRTSELAFAHARDEYRLLVDSLSDVVFAINVRAILTFVGGAATSVFGAPASRLIGTPLKDYVHPEDWPRIRDIGSEYYKSSQNIICSMEFRLLSAKGELKHVEMRFRHTSSASGQGSILSGLIRDVGERMLLERRLNDEMTRLRSIVESSGALILMVDRDLRIVMVNSGFTSMRGVGEADVVGKSLKDVVDCPLDASLLGQWLDPFADHRNQQPVQFSNSIVDATGRTRIINVTATPIFDQAGIMCNIVFIGVDDTARRETELQLFNADRLKGIGEMAATMAHEVNQPLQIIRLAAEMASEDIGEALNSGSGVDVSFVQGKLERIVTQVDRASRLVMGLRAHARDTLAEEAIEFAVADAVRGAVDLTDHLVRQVGAVLAVAVPIALPPVLGHVTRLEQVLINLINNARDSLAELQDVRREKSISVFAELTARAGREVVILTVEDTGAGLADHVLKNLFVPFLTTKPRGKGTGLGLPLCRRIVEEMGGTITAANRRKGGARFEIVLPAVSKSATPAGAANLEPGTVA